MISNFKLAIRPLSSVVVALALTAPATAANFQFARYLEIGATATDNPELEQEGTDPEAELVWNIKPSIELKFAGNRFGAVAVAEAEVFHFSDAEDEIVDPRIFARARGTLIDDLLFLDSTLTYSKISAASGFLRLSQESDPAIRLQNRLFIDKSFGQVANLYLAYGHESFFPEVGESADSKRNDVQFFLGRDPVNGGLIWSVGAEYIIDESASNEFENSSVYAALGFALNKTVLLQFNSGIEDRKFINALDTANPVTTEDDQTSLWSADLTWSPSEQTKVAIGYGERFFGRGPSLQVNHRVENSIFLARYSRDITRTAASLGGISALTSTTGTSNVQDTGSVNADDATVGRELDEPFIDNRLQLSYKLTGRRSDLIVDSVYSVQDQLAGEEQIKSWISRFVFDRRMSERTLLRFQYEHQKNEADEQAVNNYSENRFGVKFIFNFDQIEATRDEEFSE